MQSIDKKIDNLFYKWLLLTFLMVFVMVVVGGLTRLTNSGLSITEWELFSGILPPLNKEDWNYYFSLYKEIPQYQLLNSNMSLQEFKVIFYWEYIHRILGRLLGLIFLIPLLYFHFVAKINKVHLPTCYIVLFLIILQGIIGWYMVKSGLVNKISVSHYRLSIHLFMAFIIISIIFWEILNVRRKSLKKFFLNKKENYIFYFLFFIIFLQIILGAFVSGLDAGKIYQTWPLMNYSYFPNDVSIDNFKNLFDFDSHGLIQFYHRNIAYLITIYVFIIGYYLFKSNNYELMKPFFYLAIVIILQIFLGIMTLISGLNIYLASAHQISSLLLVLSAINLYFNYIK